MSPPPVHSFTHSHTHHRQVKEELGLAGHSSHHSTRGGSHTMDSKQVWWTPDEDQVLDRAVQTYGSNWSLVNDVLRNTPGLAGRLRSSQECEMRYTLVKRSKDSGVPLKNPTIPKVRARV
jgi:hypothetical protein